MEQSEPVIILENNQPVEQSKEDKPTIMDIIKTLIVFYFIIGVICYFVCGKWFETLYVTPYNYIMNLMKSDKQ